MSNDNSVRDYISNVIQRSGDQVIEQQIKKFSQKIKEYAIEFLNVYQSDMQSLQDLQTNLQNEKNAVRGIQQGDIRDSYEYRILTENRHLMIDKDYYREIVAATLKFQDRLNQLLEQKVELVYVYVDSKNNPTLYTMNEQQLLQGLYYNSPRGKFTTTIEDFNKYLKNLTKYQISENFNLDYFNFTYKQTIWRYNYGRPTGKGNLILWINPRRRGRTNKWKKAFLGNQGDIKQAYASVLLDKQINSKKLFNSEILDNNIDDFMQQVAKVDDQSGLLKGDVTVGQIEYAIKSINARTLGISQIVKIAREIRDRGVYTKENLERQKQKFHEITKSRNAAEIIEFQALDEVQKNLARKIERKNRTDMKILIESYHI